jgi:hypothetical protein
MFYVKILKNFSRLSEKDINVYLDHTKKKENQMNTTDLFVELVVIGVGVVIWISVLVLTLFGYHWVPWKNISAIIVLLPFLALTYMLGIIIDRLADKIFENWSKKIRKQYFLIDSEYHVARTYTYTYANEKIIDLFEYSRSRMRISRSWSINNLILLISAPMLIWVRFPNLLPNLRTSILIFSIIMFGLFTFASVFSWASLTKNEYKKLAETYNFLKQERNP